MIWLLFAAVGFGMYGACRAVEARARRIERDQHDLAAFPGFPQHGEPPRNVEASRWAASPSDRDGGAS